MRRILSATSGFHRWTPDEVKAFEARHEIGTKARLALALLPYLGVRRGDGVTFGRPAPCGASARLKTGTTRWRVN
jgi:hypothetical protein